MELKRTGIKIPFTDVGIGQPFFAHGRFWTRTEFDAGSELKGSTGFGSCCNFLIDGTVEGSNNPGVKCEEVEDVETV